jgi:hypothetical protein
MYGSNVDNLQKEGYLTKSLRVFHMAQSKVQAPTWIWTLYFFIFTNNIQPITEHICYISRGWYIERHMENTPHTDEKMVRDEAYGKHATHPLGLIF